MCGCTNSFYITYFEHILDYLIVMNLCSLEDDDVGNFFITQEPNQRVSLVPNFDEESDVVDVHRAKYSDISDAEDFEIPSSQM